MEEPIVEVQQGKLRGAIEDGIAVFKGVPYGADTTGEGRFKAPRPAEPWTGVRDALSFGPDAPQLVPGHSALKELFPSIIYDQSEDCLRLNVWTPAIGDGAKRPVMVWIHGGGFHYGSGVMHEAHRGGRLAKRGDVVVVTVNHRLNSLGYLYLADLFGPEFSDSGNAGMLDLVEALRWVRDNIEAFGGDPANVTIFGQSGGGAKVSTLLAMPAAQGLFHRAVVQSGARLKGVLPDAATANARDLLAELGVESGDRQALLDLPARAIVDAVSSLSKKRGEVGAGGGGFGPVVDGANLPTHPWGGTAPEFSKQVPVMVGTTRDELTYQLVMHPDFDGLDEAGLRRKLTAQIGSRPDRFGAISPEQIEHLIDAYRSTRPNDRPQDLLVALASDGTRLASIRLAEQRAAQPGAAPVYMYLFRWESPGLNGTLKSTHTLEIPFVFDNLEVSNDYVGPRPERETLMEQMSGAWLAFARTGNPDHEGLPHWPAYDETTRATMIFDAVSEVENDPASSDRTAWDVLI
ncbi:MAG: carboxylesterase/lipase family protein [Dehalococcoidia bacterium]